MTIHRTTQHREIRRWAEARRARPGFVRGAGARLGLDLPDTGPHPGLKAVDWDRWFAVFDEGHLAFVYDDARPMFYDFVEVGPETKGAS